MNVGLNRKTCINKPRGYRELGQDMKAFSQLTEDEWGTVQLDRYQAGTLRAAKGGAGLVG